LYFTSLIACGGSSGGEPIEYAALGASDVTGIGATPLTNGYVYLIEDSIQQQRGEPVNLYNLGIPGADIGTIRKVSVEFLKRAPSLNLITLSTGANDVIGGTNPTNFEQDLNELLSDLRSIAPNATIAVANIPNLIELPRFQEHPDPDVNTPRLRNFNAAIGRQTASHNALLTDLSSVPLNDSLVSDIDGFHPSDAGHRAIANQFLAVLGPYIPRL
jgi:lysophospholipase L1-like esterase